MIIYNVTVKVDWQIHEAWVEWMLGTHMPEVVATGCFDRSQLVRLLETDEEDGPTYAAQYMAPSLESYQRYIDTYSTDMRQKAFEAWGNRFIAFRSLMQVVG